MLNNMPNDQERLAALEARIDSHDDAIKTMCSDIKDIKDNLLKRPSWVVSIIITILVGICSSLLVFVGTSL